MFTNNSRIDYSGASISAYGLKFTFSNNITVKANVTADCHWDDEGFDYTVQLVSNPGVEVFGTRIDLEHNVLDKHPRFQFSCSSDDEDVFFDKFKQELMSVILDMEYEKYYEDYDHRQ